MQGGGGEGGISGFSGSLQMPLRVSGSRSENLNQEGWGKQKGTYTKPISTLHFLVLRFQQGRFAECKYSLHKKAGVEMFASQTDLWSSGQFEVPLDA